MPVRLGMRVELTSGLLYTADAAPSRRAAAAKYFMVGRLV